MLDLTGKVAAVTGAGSGIGRGVALALARAGADIAVSDAFPGRADAIAKEVRALGRQAHAADVDVRDRAGLEDWLAAARAELGGIEICVANAGVARGGSILTMTEEHWDTQIDVNLKGVFLTVQAGARAIIKNGKGGRIIVISSIAGERPEPGAFAYCASKAGVRMMARCWAVDLAPFGITVNSIAPGIIDTPLAIGIMGEGDVRAENERRIPAGRFGQPGDIGSIACWLASDEAEYVNGTYNVVDGGLLEGTGWGMETGMPDPQQAIREALRTMSGEQVLAMVDGMTAEAMKQFEVDRAARGLL